MKFYRKPNEVYSSTAKCKVAYDDLNELAVSIANYIVNHIEELLYLPYHNMTAIDVTQDIKKYLRFNFGELIISVNTDNEDVYCDNSDVQVFEFLYQHIVYFQTSHYMVLESCWIRGDSIETTHEYIDQGASPINIEKILNSHFEVK
jgi:hypothetical protein